MRMNRGVVVFFVLLGVAMLVGAVVMWLSADGVTEPGLEMGALILGGLGVFYLLLMFVLWLFVKRRNRLAATGRPAIATIISARDSGTMVNNQPRLVLEIEITPEDGGAPYRFETKKVVGHSSLAAMRPGASLAVAVDPQRPQRFTFIDAEQYASMGGRAATTGTDQLVSFLRNAGLVPGTVDAATAGPQGAGSDDDRLGRLERLAALHASGALSDDEFAAEKQRLLDEQ
jgi:hypothetical protein